MVILLQRRLQRFALRDRQESHEFRQRIAFRSVQGKDQSESSECQKILEMTISRFTRLFTNDLPSFQPPITQCNGKSVSIFKFDSSFSSQPDKVTNAKASIKRLKTLRHPSIISIIDSNEVNHPTTSDESSLVTIFPQFFSKLPINFPVNFLTNSLFQESNDIFFVTEYVIPLKVYLEENLSSYTKEQKYYTASYGLCQVAVSGNESTSNQPPRNEQKRRTIR